MTSNDRKDIVRRLKKVDRKLWNSLSSIDQDKAVEKYYKLTDPKELGMTDLVTTVWTRSESVGLVALGLALGLVGSLTGSAMDRYFTGVSEWYDPIIGLVFLLVLFGFSKLEDLVVTVGYRHGNLLKRLLESEN